jgi:hypothetical protein
MRCDAPQRSDDRKANSSGSRVNVVKAVESAGAENIPVRLYAREGDQFGDLSFCESEVLTHSLVDLPELLRRWGLGFLNNFVVVALLDKRFDQSNGRLNFRKLLFVRDHFFRLQIATAGERIPRVFGADFLFCVWYECEFLHGFSLFCPAWAVG